MALRLGNRSRYPRRFLLAGAALVLGSAAVLGQYGGANLDPWWEAGEGVALPLWVTFPNPSGAVMVMNSEGQIETAHHPFFEPLGNNGRACVTCHQPSNAMSLAVSQVQERWRVTQGKDPVFAAVDGSNCPNLPQAQKASHSLLLTRGLVRISQPWPARDGAGKPIDPEFTIEVVRDPTGCNTDAVYGLHSAHPAVSVFRRPRVVGNVRFVLDQPLLADANAPAAFAGRLTADGRDTTLADQAIDAAHAHEQSGRALTPEELRGITAFESQLFVAQTADNTAGDLAEVDGPLGAWSLGRSDSGRASAARSDPHRPIFFEAAYWSDGGRGESHTAAGSFRASVARGNAIFSTRTFAMKDADHAPAATGTCATCHNAPMSGSNLANQAMNVGTTVQPYSGNLADLPLFKITCKQGLGQPYAGRTVYSTDPGRALVTGKCSDVGSIVMQQFRGLAARAPYFSNGSAATLRDVVDFYDQRFDIGLTESEKKDLTNFLSVL